MSDNEEGGGSWILALKMRIAGFYERIRYLSTQFSLGRWDELSSTELILVYPTILLIQVFRELIRDRGLVRASSLAFTTVLSVVPLLTVATTLSAAFGVGEKALIDMLKNMLPVSADAIMAQLSQFSQSQGGALSGIGSVVLIFLGVALFNNIEHAFNDIWRIRKRRALVSKFLTFYALITLAPLMLTISIVESARIQIYMDGLPFFASVGYKLLPLGLAVVAFTSANKLLPHTEVKWVPALVSGVVTAIAFELAKTGFNLYITKLVMDSYTTVYGALSLIPIFLVWVYLCWVIVLFGAEMTYTIQNLRFLLLPQRLHDINENNERRFNPLIGLEVFAPIASAFKQSHGPIKMARLAAIAGVPLKLAREVIDRLLKARIVFEVEFLDSDGTATGYIPARPLSDIPVIDVLDACRDPLNKDEQSPFMRSLFMMHHSKEEELFGRLTCTALVDDDDPERMRVFAGAIAGRVNADAEAEESRQEKLKDNLTRVSQELQISLPQIKVRDGAKGKDDKDEDASETPKEPAANPIDALLGDAPDPA